MMVQLTEAQLQALRDLVVDYMQRPGAQIVFGDGLQYSPSDLLVALIWHPPMVAVAETTAEPSPGSAPTT